MKRRKRRIALKLRCCLEITRYPKKRIRNKAVPQAAQTGKLSNAKDLRNNKDKNDSNISKNDSRVLNIWYTNTDTFTEDKIRELKDVINASSPPDIIAVTEFKPKKYTKELQIVEYKIVGYEFESVNLKDRGSTRGVRVYFRKSLCLNLEKNKKQHSRRKQEH